MTESQQMMLPKEGWGKKSIEKPQSDEDLLELDLKKQKSRK